MKKWKKKSARKAKRLRGREGRIEVHYWLGGFFANRFTRDTFIEGYYPAVVHDESGRTFKQIVRDLGRSRMRSGH